MALFYLYIYKYLDEDFNIYASDRKDADAQMKEQANADAERTGNDPAPFSFVRRERW